MPVTPSKCSPFVPAVLAAIALSACQPQRTPTTDAASAAEPGACVGATAEEAAQDYNPRIVRGRVLAPFGKLATRSPFPDWLVGTAHAAPLVKERTVPNATVELFRVGPGGQRTGEVLREATTDVKGQWCMKLPDGVELGSDLMIAAEANDTRLRRSLVSPVTTDLYSGTEALTRLLQSKKVDFTNIPTPTYLNMGAIADTTFDLLDPVKLQDGDTVDTTVARIQAVLTKDPRLTKKIQALPKRPN